MTDIGATLREARMRARIDVSEIEAQTKIRAKYLRALENEEWDLLPGPTFVRSFLRTYAQALDLDDKPLVDEYRRRRDPPPDLDQPVVSGVRRAQQRRGERFAGRGAGGRSGRGLAGSRAGRVGSAGRPRGYTIAVGFVCLVIVLLVIGLLSNGKGKGGKSPTSARGGQSATATAGRHSRHHSRSTGSTAGGTRRASTRASLSLHPSGPVYVCLIGDDGRKVIPGEILQPSSYTPVTYHARRFEITLGNDAVSMYVNGKPRTVAPSSKAIGYSVTASGRHTLPAEQLPTCE